MSTTNGARTPSPTPGRSLDIELSGQEIITVDLDNLDANPDDLLEVLRDSQSKVIVWTKLATEYWKRGYLEGAEKLATGAHECMLYNCDYIEHTTYMMSQSSLQPAKGRLYHQSSACSQTL